MADMFNRVIIGLMSVVMVIILVTLMTPPSEESILFLGDTSMGKWYLKGKVLETSPFVHYEKLLLDSDYVLLNLEAPITTVEASPYEGEKNYLNWDSPDETPQFLSDLSVDAVCLANNHLFDFGEQGIQETIDSLGSIGSFGAGMNEAEAEAPYVMQVSGRDIVVVSGFEYRGLYYEEFAYYAGEDKPGVALLHADTVKTAREHYPDAFIVAYPHWGDNYEWRTEGQQQYAQELVEAGADLILGHGAHLFQEIELIGNTYVVYSLGNFVFNSKGGYSSSGMHPYSLIARLVFTKDSTYLRLYPTYTDNRVTNYQGRFLTQAEFSEAVWLLDEKSSLQQGEMPTGKDEYGFYVELTL